MKVDNKTIKVDQKINFNDKAINKLSIKKGKVVKLAKGSQRTYARFLIGYHKRFDQLIFNKNEKGWGTIKLKDFSNWESF